MPQERIQKKSTQDAKAQGEAAEQSAVQRKPQTFDAGQQSLSPTSHGGYAEQSSSLSPVQAKGEATGPDVHTAAQQGVSGGGAPLPHLDRIQAAFGHHDVSAVQAHTGGAAQTATKSIGAEAYATGNSVAFGKAPDLHTAAHEATHILHQRSGVSLDGGVGKAGDSYERHADAVADRVVQGKSATDLLDGFVGGPAVGVQMKASPAVQRKETRKKVSKGAMGRIVHARDAIKHTKEAMKFGAGNQVDAIRATNSNSYWRMKIMRNRSLWDIAPSVKAIASANPAALTAAKADVAHGGNCGEHASVAYDYLRVVAKGEPIARVAVKGLDHAFVFIGDHAKEGDEEIAVSDPWPTAATACTWADHFAYESDRAKIKTKYSMVADGQNVKKVIAAGLKLNARGKAMLDKKDTSKRTEERIKESWVWDHADAADDKYEYHSE